MCDIFEKEKDSIFRTYFSFDEQLFPDQIINPTPTPSRCFWKGNYRLDINVWGLFYDSPSLYRGLNRSEEFQKETYIITSEINFSNQSYRFDSIEEDVVFDCETVLCSFNEEFIFDRLQTFSSGFAIYKSDSLKSVFVNFSTLYFFAPLNRNAKKIVLPYLNDEKMFILDPNNPFNVKGDESFKKLTTDLFLKYGVEPSMERMHALLKKLNFVPEGYQFYYSFYSIGLKELNAVYNERMKYGFKK
jgi:hypothetical protein